MRGSRRNATLFFACHLPPRISVERALRPAADRKNLCCRASEGL